MKILPESIRSLCLFRSLAVLAAVMLVAGCGSTANVGNRCDAGSAAYPLQHTLPDGSVVNVYEEAHACSFRQRPIWVTREDDGQRCGIGYQCVSRRGNGR